MEPIRELHLDDLPNELLHFVLEYLEKPDLTALAVASPRFGGVIWSLLRRLKISLKKIETDAGSLLKQCSELRYLEVSDGPNWQIESLAALPNPSYLTQLVLRNCDKFRLYDGSLEYYFPKLETVHFISCPGVGDSALPWIPKHIKDLSLENCRKISDEGLALLPKHCTALTGLDLKGCYRLSGDGLVNCLTQLTQLKHIVLAKLYKLGDEHLEKITKQCSQLENVDIRFLKIEDRGLRAIEENCKNLKEIHLKFCTVTNPGVISLLTHSTKLVNIDLQGIKSLSDDALETIADHCPLAESIDLRDCTDIGKDNLKFEKMLIRCTNLQALMLRNMVINDDILDVIATSASTSLRLLTMQECKSITLDGLKALSNSTVFKNLTLLDLTAIPFTTEELDQINDLFLSKRWITCYSDDKKPRIAIGFGTKWQEKPGL